MLIDLYYMPISPYCRSVQLTAHSLGVELNILHLDLLKNEHLQPEFLALNPQHTVPTFIDGDLVLWESRAICCYLVSAYGKDDSLYPKEPKKRAFVDRMLYFEMGTLGVSFSNMLFASMADESYSPTSSEIDKFHKALGYLEMFLKDHKWAAGSQLTVADLVLVATISGYVKGGLSLEKYPCILKWFKQCEEEIPGYKLLNEKGAEEAGTFYKQKLP
ncbi:unnamed protein product, partial [Meganyctiphanes norvegica]